jgi:hypothetical protein
MTGSFIVMEFLDSKTLKTDSLADLAVQIADGLDSAHSRGTGQLTSPREVRICPHKSAILPFPPPQAS